ncbi:MAG: hypothetical protein R3F04_05535 [Lysobacteraceae bacterium]
MPEEVPLGQPINFSLTVTARGLVPAQLPELELPDIDGAAIYPDQSATRDRSDADGLGAERMRSFAIVPQRAGELTIPAIRLQWWDVNADAARTAEVPARSIRVVPAAGAESPSAPLPAATTGAEESLTPAEQGSPPSAGGSMGLPLQGMGLGSAWPWMLLTALMGLGWWRSARRYRAATAQATPATRSPPIGAAGPRLAEALARKDLSAVAAALRRECPTGPCLLSAMASVLEDPHQREALLELEQQLFCAGSAPSDALSSRLQKVFRSGPRWRSATRATAAGPGGFSPLYG